MSDFMKPFSSGDELDAILNEVRKTKQSSEEEAPSKTWSLDDIDRLIAQSNGEEYVPKAKKAPTPAQDFKRILSRDFDSEIFTVKPLVPEPEPEDEMPDISSTSADIEVEGQETFFDDAEEFDESLFEIETVVVPEDIPEPSEIKYAKKEPEPSKKKEPPQIKVFYEGEASASDFFAKKIEERPGEIKKDDRISVNDYRTRFFSTLELENTGEIELPEEARGPIEKPGIVVAKAGPSQESGLEALPKLLAAEDAKEIADGKTRVIGSIGEVRKDFADGDDVDGQIVLTGFDDAQTESVPEKARENDVEEQLWEKRRQRAKNFKIIDASDIDSEFSGDFEAPPEERIKAEKAQKKKAKRRETQQESIPVANEYSSPAQRASVHERLSAATKKATTGIIVIGIIETIIIIVNLLPLIAEKLSLETTVLISGSALINVINAVLLIIAAAVNNVHFVDGLSDIFKRRVSSNTAVSLSIIVALIQNTLAAVMGGSELDTAVFSAAAVMGVLIDKITLKLDAQRILGNFEVCAYKYEHNMYAVHPFENESEIFELGRGLMMGNADLLYSSKLAFPSDFIGNSNAKPGEKKLMSVLIPVTFAGAIVVALAAGIINESIMTGVAAFSATFCVCSPIFAAFISALAVRVTNASLNLAGTMVVSLNTAEKTAAANAVVMDSADIFDRSKCTMHGMKDFKNIRIDDVLLYAAALVIKSGGPLRDSFEQVVDGRQDLLPPVKELVYEDKLGIAARIHGQKVLLGNRNLLVHHNIEVPEKTIEERYSHSGRKVMYLAVAGKIAALFVVSYAVDENLTAYFKMLESNGIQVLVRTNDVNVTEALISKSFGLPQETFKVLSSVAGRLFKRRRDAVCDKLPAGIIHDGTSFSMLRSVAASCGMSSKVRLGTAVQVILSVLGFVACAALYCTSLGVWVNSLTACAFIAAGLALCTASMLIGKVK